MGNESISHNCYERKCYVLNSLGNRNSLISFKYKFKGLLYYRNSFFNGFRQFLGMLFSVKLYVFLTVYLTAKNIAGKAYIEMLIKYTLKNYLGLTTFVDMSNCRFQTRPKGPKLHLNLYVSGTQ